VDLLFAYRPALDGLRAMAVLPVLLYHAELEFASGGFLGVDLFFVISGYLITTLLLREASERGLIRLGAFWIRRARRLFPALFCVLACVLLYGLIASETELARMAGDVYSTLGYVANWWFAFSGESYFDQFARPSMLRHTWSLAIEEQFYVVWPLVAWWGIRGAVERPRIWFAIALLGAIASAVLMRLLFESGTDPSRVYYGTDTRAQALLIGVALAFLLANVPDEASESGARASFWSNYAGAAGIFVCLGFFHVATDRAGWMYQGGYLAMALASAGAVAGAV
jgi:peptidoglycan/LPS O-acetylase OafA/YrhL